MAVRCPSCLHAVAPGELHCLECGAPLRVSCPQCGAGLARGAYLCHACLAEVAHVGSPATSGGGPPPLAAAAASSVELSRWRIVREGLLASAPGRRMVLPSRPPNGSGEPLDAGRGLADLVARAAAAHDCAAPLLLRSPEGRGVRAYGTPGRAVVVLGGRTALLLDEEEAAFLVLGALHPVLTGAVTVLRFAGSPDAGELPEVLRRDLERWVEAVGASADRFAATIVPSPSLWLRAVLKSTFPAGKDLVSLLDGLGRVFPDEPALVASRLSSSPEVARRLLDLAELVRDEAWEGLQRQASSLRGWTSPVAKGRESEEAEVEVSGPSSTVRSLRSLSKPRSDGGDEEADRMGVRAAAAARTPILSGDLLYLSSYRNALALASPTLTNVVTWPLLEWCRCPRSVAVDLPRRRLYVSDFESSSILVLDFRGRMVATWGGSDGHRPSFHRPAGLAVDDQGRLWVADSWNDRVVRLDVRGEVDLVVTGDPTHFRRPMAVAQDPGRGGVWVADTGGGRVLRLGEDGHVVHVVGQGLLAYPEGLAVAPDGCLVVADTGNGVVRVLEAAGDLVAVLDPASAGGSRHGGPPHAVACGPAGEVVAALRDGGFLVVFSGAGGLVTEAPIDDRDGCAWPGAVVVARGLVGALREVAAQEP